MTKPSFSMSEDYYTKVKALFDDYKTFGASEDPENFEPYISFDRRYDFVNFWTKFRSITNSILASQREKIIQKIKEDIVKANGVEGVTSPIVNYLDSLSPNRRSK